MKLSIAVPTHAMKNEQFFLNRLQDSLDQQTFQDFELIMTREGAMAKNTNSAIKCSKGELIKVLYMDDYLRHPHALQDIVDGFSGQWLVTGCEHDDGKKWFNPHYPTWNDNIQTVNTIGSPSVLTIKNDNPLLFDETMTWMLDGDYYRRMYDRFGPPTILNTLNVIIGIHEGQTTNLLSDELKAREHTYMLKKHHEND